MTLANFKSCLFQDLPFEISNDLLSYEPGADTKNIKLKQHLCVRHAMPKTNLYGTILHENTSQDRHLERQLSNLSTRQLKISNSFDLSARTFMKNQQRKQAKWKREDEFRLSGLNLPNVQIAEEHRRPSFDVMYHAPEYSFSGSTASKKDKLPKMPFSIRREKTEIVTHRERTFMTRLPEVMVVDQDALKVYNKYRGKAHLKPGGPTRDGRFQKLATSLSEPHIKNKSAPGGRRGHMSRSSSESKEEELDKLSDFPDDESEDLPPKWMLTRAQTDMIVSKPKRHDEDSISVHQPNRMKSEAILETFKKGNVKQLAKSLSKNKSERDKTVKAPTQGTNVYYSKK